MTSDGLIMFHRPTFFQVANGPMAWQTNIVVVNSFEGIHFRSRLRPLSAWSTSAESPCSPCIVETRSRGHWPTTGPVLALLSAFFEPASACCTFTLPLHTHEKREWLSRSTWPAELFLVNWPPSPIISRALTPIEAKVERPSNIALSLICAMLFTFNVTTTKTETLLKRHIWGQKWKTQ